MNLVVLLQLGATLESTLGTLSFLYHVVVFCVFTPLILFVISFFFYLVSFPTPYLAPTLGITMPAIGLTAFDAVLRGNENRAAMFLFTVPAMIYPWVCIVMFMIVIPAPSFVANASGWIFGHLYATFLSQWMRPSDRFWRACDRFCPLAFVTGYVEAGGRYLPKFEPTGLFSWMWNANRGYKYKNTPKY
jgi:membrane associated rhomboid family serine protease